MSGHSKWATIRKQKESTDAKRGAVFTKLSRNITLAAREKGGDPNMNANLRVAIEKAKQFNMPKDNIERAIKKGTGELEGVNYEEIIYEAYGPSGIALIIKCITDNKNRTAANIRHILTKSGGSLGEPNTVMWMFENKGVIRFKEKELADKNISMDDFELSIIDAGAEDIQSEEGDIAIYTNIKDMQNVKESAEKMQINLESSEIEWIPKNEVDIKDEDDKEKIAKLFNALDDDEDVQDIYTNATL